jgi:hypothetical protein
VPEALTCDVVVVGDVVVGTEVVLVNVFDVQVVVAVGATALVESTPMRNVEVAERVLESSSDGAAVVEAGPTGAAEQAPSVTSTAAVAATRDVIFM